MIIRLLACLTLIATLALMFAWWHFAIGFQVWKAEWWVWLVKYIYQTNQFPPKLVIPTLTGIAVLILAPVLILAISARAGSKDLTGGRSSDELHGSAAWADKKTVQRLNLFNSQGVIIGGWPKGNRAIALRHNGPEHIICFAPTRSGKGVGIVLPTLLTWPESVLVLDIKGENFALTAGYRAGLGHNIYRFAPAAETGSIRYNPLQEVRIKTHHVIADCQNISIMMIDPDGKGLKDYWLKAGNAWLSVALLHVLHRIPKEHGRTANLSDVGSFMSGFSGEKEAEEGFNALLDAMMIYDHGDSEVNRAVTEGAKSMKIKAMAEKSGVHSSASEPLRLYTDPIVAKNIAVSDFRLSELMNGDRPAALYLVIPPKDIVRLRPLIRIIMSQFLNGNMTDMAFDGGEQIKGHKYRLLMMLDEFTSVGKMDIFQTALAYMAGYGLKACIIIQDLAQLQDAYGRNESIVSNCHVRVAYAPNKIETAEVLSKMSGISTVTQIKTSLSADHAQLIGGNVSNSLSETSRPLLTADECMRLKGAEKTSDGRIRKPGDMLIFIAGQSPILGRQYLYFQNKKLLARAALPAPPPTERG